MPIQSCIIPSCAPMKMEKRMTISVDLLGRRSDSVPERAIRS